MKHIIKNIITGIMAVSAITSCNSFLDTDPYASIDDTKAIKDYSSAFYALTGTYNSMQNTSYYGRDFVVFGDAATENVIISPNNSNRFIAEAQWSISPTSGDMQTFWAKAYETIYDANKILQAVDNIEATDVQKAAIKAQALSVRALSHFDLVRFFAQSYKGNESLLGVPYMKTTNNYDKPSRNTIQEVYGFIIADLQEAITNFNTVSTSDGSGGDMSGLIGTGLNTTTIAPYAISSWAAKGILARVYMSQQNYTAANPLLNDIITNSGYSILPNDKYVDAWSRAYNNTKNMEFIFAIRNVSDDYGATNCLGYIYIQGGYGDLRAPANLRDLYKSTDIRKTLLFKVGTGTQTSWYFVNKYPGRDGTAALSDIPVLRLSDIYLMYAEAQANIGTLPEAIKYLDKIRMRADASAVATPATTSKDDLLNLIFLERRKELAYEGHYLFDLKRLQKTINSGYRSDNTLYTTINYPNDMLAMPIPQAEMDANTNMVQNPGY